MNKQALKIKVKLHLKKIINNKFKELITLKLLFYKDLKSLVLYTNFFCLHKLGLKDWMHKASRFCRWKMFSAFTKPEKFSSFWFLAHSWLFNKRCPITEKYFFTCFSEWPSNQLFKIFGTCWSIVTWSFWDVFST